VKSEQNDKWSLISKKLANETKPSEDFIFDDWISQDGNKKLYETIERIKLDCDYEPAIKMKEKVFEETFDKIFSQKQNDRNKSKTMTFVLSIAAGIAILISIISIYSAYNRNMDNSAVVFSSPTGISKIILPDSTLVTLNIGSTITYASNFNKETRQVNLKGEAFFEVKHNSKKPFIVSTEKIDVKVLGTVFNVKAYSDKDEVVTSLVSGSVELTEKSRNQTIRLSPGQASIYNKETTDMRLCTFDPKHIKDWMNEELIFDKESFQSVCQILEQKFDTKIEIRNTKIGDKLFSGKFTKDESLPEILDIIKIIVSFSYKTEGDTIIIY